MSNLEVISTNINLLFFEECDLQRFHSVIEHLDDSIDAILENQINFAKSYEKLSEKFFDDDDCMEYKELKSEMKSEILLFLQMKEVKDDVRNIKRDLASIKSILKKINLK